MANPPDSSALLAQSRWWTEDMNRYLCRIGLLLSLVLLTACTNEQRLFYRLQEARRQADRARPLATEVSKTSKGVELALADMNVFGGTTGGWSSWILMESALTNEVEPKLKGIIANRSADPENRIEAAHIMWVRTKNTGYLETMFEIVRSPGDLATEWGRRKLATAIDPEEVVKKVTVPSTEPIPLTVEEFHLLIQDPRNLRIPSGD